MSGAVSVGVVKGTLQLDDQWNTVLSKSATGLASFSKQTADIGKKLSVGVSLPLMAAGTAAVSFAKNFATTMTKVETLADVNRKQVEAWKKDLLALAPAMGRGPAELANGLLVVTSAGERGTRALDVLKEAAKASAVGLGDTGTVARAITGTMQAYSASNLDAATAARVMTATVVQGNVEADELAGTLGRVVGIAAQAGVSFNEVGAFMATFTRLGVDAAEATTALRGVLSTVIKPSQDARDALASMKDPTTGAAYSIEALRAAIKEKGLTQALLDLYAMVGDNVDALGAIIPNVRALSGFLGTAGSQGAQFAEIIKEINKAANDASYLNDKFARTTEDLGFKWEQTKAKMQAYLIDAGNRLMPHLQTITDRGIIPLTDKIGNLLDAFGKLPKGMQDTVMGIVAIGAVVGPATLAVSGLAKAVQGLTGALVWLSGTTLVTSIRGIVALLSAEGMGGAALVWLNLKAAIIETAGALGSLALAVASKLGPVMGLLWLSAGMKGVTGGQSLKDLEDNIAKVLSGTGGKFTPPKAPTPVVTTEATFALAPGAAKKSAAGVKELSDELKKLIAEFSGAALLQKARDYESALRAIGGASRLTKEEQAEFRDTFIDVIAKYKLLGAPGKAVVDHFQALLNTMPLVSTSFAANLDILPSISDATEEYRKNLFNLASVGWHMGIKVMPTIGKQTLEVKREVIPLTDALNDLSSAFGQLGDIGDGALSGIVRGVGTMISALNLAIKGAAAFEKGIQAWKDARTEAEKMAAGLSVGAGALTAAAGMFQIMFSVVGAIEAHDKAQRQAYDSTVRMTEQFIKQAGGVAALRQQLALTGVSWDAWSTALKNARGNAERTQSMIDQLEQGLENLKIRQEAATDLLGLLNVQVSDWAKSIADAAEGTVDAAAAQARFNSLSSYAVATFAALLHTTGDYYGALKQMGPTLKELAGAQGKLNLSASAAIKELLGIQDVADKYAQFLDPLSAATQMIGLLTKAGVISQDAFSALGRDAVSAFNAMLKGGTDSRQAMILMQPTLQALWQQWKDGKIAIDAETEALLKQAEAAGLVGDNQRSINDRMLDAFKALREAIDKMTLAITDWGKEAENAYRRAAIAAGQYVGIAIPRGSIPAPPGGGTGTGGARPRGSSAGLDEFGVAAPGYGPATPPLTANVYIDGELWQSQQAQGLDQHYRVMVR